MSLSPEDIARLQAKELANAIRKLNAGKTLTAAERALIHGGGASASPGFAKTLDALADALGVSRRAISEWRKDPRYKADCPRPRADGRHDVAAWRAVMEKHGLKRADEFAPTSAPAGPEVIQPPPFGGVAADWNKANAAIEFERNKLRLEQSRGTLLVASDLEIPLGATFLAVGQRLSQFPERAGPQVTGFTDVQEVIAILRTEIERDLGELHGARHLDITVEQVIASLAVPEEIRAAVTTATLETLRRIGRAAMAVEQPVEQPAPKPQEIPTDAAPKVAKPVKKKRRSSRQKR